MFTTMRRDIRCFFDRDPAARSVWEIILCYPGLHALWFYRVRALVVGTPLATC